MVAAYNIYLWPWARVPGVDPTLNNLVEVSGADEAEHRLLAQPLTNWNMKHP